MAEEVNKAGVVIRVHETGKNRIIGLGKLDKAWDYLQQHGTVTQTQIFDMGTRSSACVVVFLSNLPGVSYQLNPIRLVINKSN